MSSQPLTMESESDHFSPYRADGKLYGFVCVVTGADQPIGAAIVTELTAHGAASIYACTSITTTSAPSSISNLSNTHPSTRIIPYPYSISSEHDTLTLIDEALNAYGRLDVWICSTSLLGPSSINATNPADLQACFEANSLAPFFALKYAPPAMTKLTQKGTYTNAAPKDQVYGSIVVVSSTASIYGGYGGPCYTMSSHAALGVVRAGVAVLKGTGVRINCISPGQIDVNLSFSVGVGGGINLPPPSTKHANGDYPPTSTKQTQPQPQPLSSSYQTDSIGLERPGLPVEVGRVAGFLASGFSSYITGANLVVDGGASVMCPLMVPM